MAHSSSAGSRQSVDPEDNKLNLLEIRDSSIPKTPRPFNDSVNDFPARDLTLDLVDLFFTNPNATFPLIHKGMFKDSLNRGEVFNGLLWAVMAVAARFSKDSRIKTSPPHLASDRFASRAISCIDANTFEPTLYNLQFWGIMSSYEYGRASGARAWMYGGMAIRICLELGMNKEETLSEPMYGPDGKVDELAMALRRRIFWSTYSIDKFASAGTNRPQTLEEGDSDCKYPTVAESLILLEIPTSLSEAASKDTLVDVPVVHLSAVRLFGEVNRYMNRAKPVSGKAISWPPIPQFQELDRQVRSWRADLPERFHFTPSNLARHRTTSSKHYMYLWLSAHILWATSALVLHRASLAFSGKDLIKLVGDPYTIARDLERSISLCKEAVDMVMDIFSVIIDECGSNIQPFICYTAYTVATVLMTNRANELAASQRSNKRLSILYKVMEHMEPYWPMCARVAATTKQLHNAHSRMYTISPETELYDNRKYDQATVHQFSPPTPRGSSKDKASSTSPVINESPKPPVSPPKKKRKVRNHLIDAATSTYPVALQPALVPGLDSHPENASVQTGYPTPEQHALPVEATLPHVPWMNDNTDFNSVDFLFDGTLFGQTIFDGQRMPPPGLVEANNLDMHLFNGPLPNASEGFANYKPLWDVEQ
ncbi:fungal-specific transcription factor domain-containing protein [Umbelopsis sp. PMI_123]|nr:fungal-specific transcription factor domain-containing protein [Umbelopsis sp. PMI_123]